MAAELAAGAAGQGEGLAFRIVEAGYRLKIPMMYAAVLMLCLCGLALYGAFAELDRILYAGGGIGPKSEPEKGRCGLRETGVSFVHLSNKFLVIHIFAFFCVFFALGPGVDGSRRRSRP